MTFAGRNGVGVESSRDSLNTDGWRDTPSLNPNRRRPWSYVLRSSRTIRGGWTIIIDGHLFPTLRAVPGYVGAFFGRDPSSGQLISVSFWRSDADALAGEEAVGRAIGALPRGSAPRPAKVETYVVEYRDLREQLSK